MAFNMTNLRGKIQQISLTFLLLAVTSHAQPVSSMVSGVSDSAIFAAIAGLQAFGTRYYYAGNAMQVSEWVRQQFLAAGLTDAGLDTFTVGATVQANVVATLAGNRNPEKEIIVGAHIDSRTLPIDNAPGADDDASGTAAILEIARVMVSSGYKPPVTIRFIGFAAEEPGLLGSGSYALSANKAKTDITLMINFDMIGYATPADPERRFNIIYYPPDTETADLVATAASWYTSLKPVMTTVDQGNVDSYSFAAAGYNAVTCMEFLDNPFYHQPTDLISTLDSAYTRDIVRTGLATILLFAGTAASTGPSDLLLPARTRLEQNYPNPFNPVTTIKYTVGVAGGGWQVAAAGDEGRGSRGEKTRLVVYDLLGREVAVLVNEEKPPGNYEVSFDGTSLASGMYIYRLTAGSFTRTRKMTLVK